MITSDWPCLGSRQGQQMITSDWPYNIRSNFSCVMGEAEETINTLLGAKIFFWANPCHFAKKIYSFIKFSVF